ncbi:MAG: HDIG domain-containing protein [Nitrospinae bacterium]|nr:HDIG domain-containing protein [Nitrospinota bacterium]
MTGQGGKEKPKKLKAGAEQLKNIYIGRRRVIDNLKEGLAEIFASGPRFYAAFGVIVFAVSAAVFIPSSRLSSEVFSEGEVAHRNIYAPADITVEDEASTEKKRSEASAKVQDSYDLDAAAGRTVVDRIRRAFGIVQQGYLKNQPLAYRYVLREIEERELMEFGPATGAGAETRLAAHEALRAYEESPDFAAVEKSFHAALGVSLPAETTAVLRAHHYRPHIAEWLSIALSEAMQAGVVADLKLLPVSSKSGIAIIDLATGKNGGVMDYRDVADVAGARAFVKSRLDQLMASQPLSLQKGVVGIAEKLVTPNLTFNRAHTIESRREVRDAIAPIAYEVKKGELVVREGEKITPEHLAKIERMRSGLRFGGNAQTLAGTLLFIALVIMACGFYVRIYMPEFAAARSNVALLAIILVGQAALLRLFGGAAEVFATHNPAAALGAYLYAAPFAVAPLLAAMFFSLEAAVLVSIVTAVSAGILFKPMHAYVMFAFAGGLVAVFHTGRITRRSEVWRVGGRLMAVNTLVLVMIKLMDGSLLMMESFHAVLFGILGAVLAVMFVLTLPPLIESVFPVVSDIKLLELQDLNHPLLAKMAVVAPGTYHHSIIVGNLAEDAAEAIGANPLLARVGAYFHDIGKLHKPEYFIENQRDGLNKHDTLNPTMSALILTSHVTRGLEMAKEHKLIPQIQDMIAEHHGTQVIQYFYHRAREMEKDGAVSEQNFRYPGRRPHTRESAIVALADAVEAASRTLKNPASVRLQQLVSKIINDKFVSGQLDDSHLTLHDINKIGDSFVRILHGIFHYRVEYPGDKIEDESADNLKAAGQGAESRPDTQKAPVNIKRVG